MYMLIAKSQLMVLLERYYLRMQRFRRLSIRPKKERLYPVKPDTIFFAVYIYYGRSAEQLHHTAHTTHTAAWRHWHIFLLFGFLRYHGFSCEQK
jgi:hypothetical protein